MATSNNPQHLLVGDDKPTDKLLNRIARHVLYESLHDIALDVGMDEARLSHIKKDFRDEAKEQIYQVYFFQGNGMLLLKGVLQ